MPLNRPRFLRATGAALALALLASGTASSAALPNIATDRLSATKVTMDDVSRPGIAGKAFVAGTIIAAPIEKICSTLLDFAAYPQFMPNTASAVASQTAANNWLVDMTLKLPMGKVKKYRLKMDATTSDKQCQLAWTMAPWPGLKPDETIADTSGAWQLTPAPGHPEQTVVRYGVATDPGPVPLGLGWIVDSLSKDSIPKMLEALRTRVTQAHP